MQMDDAKKVGRIVGALLLAKLLIGPIENFTLMGPIVAKPDGFLVNAAAHPLNLPLAVMLSFLLCLITLAKMAVAYPLFRRAAPQLALWFVALSIVGIATTLVEGITMMSMQSLSLAYAAAAGATPELYQGLKGVVGGARNFAHYTNLLVGGFGLFMMFLLLYRARLVPRVLAGFGMATGILQMYSLGRPFFGAPVMFELLAPMGLTFLLTSGWLLWKGFAEPKA
jgi:hypothetical protein